MATAMINRQCCVDMRREEGREEGIKLGREEGRKGGRKGGRESFSHTNSKAARQFLAPYFFNPFKS